MGGDFGPHCIVPASLSCLAESPSLHLVLVGQSSLLEQLVAQHPGVDRSRLKIVDAPEIIGMAERPAQALRGKPRSSMRIALEQVRDGNANACVSAGNTGALMALARQVLRTLPGIDRPAMVTALPTQADPCLLLDLGANVDCPPEQLFQFAVMGAVAAESLGRQQPRVALLNVGTEEIKGNQQVKQAALLLQQAADLNYQGFIEGDGLYRGGRMRWLCRQHIAQIQRGLGWDAGRQSRGAFQTFAWRAHCRCCRIAVVAPSAGGSQSGSVQRCELSRAAGNCRQESW